MIGMTLCSGIGAPEMAAPWIDWRFASEIEPFPREVLRQRFGYQVPEDQNQGEPLLWSDMTEVTPDLLKSRGIPLPDILVAGTPCQDFSIAGLRAGTSGDRGNLTLKFVEIVHAIVDARPDGKLAVIWENVPGILSDKGNAFGNFLGGLVGGDAPIQPPRGESWPGVGMVAGPLGRAAWATLDAQWFGVAQRRRRVFVVVDFGGACDPAKVLFEPKGLCGNPPPSREKGEGVAATLEASTGGVSGKDDPQGRVVQASHWGDGDVHPSLNQSHNTGGIGSSNQEVFSQGGAGLVPAQVGFRMAAFGEYSDDETASTLKQRDFKDATDLVAFDCKGTEVQSDTEVHPPLRSMGHLDSHSNAGGHAAVAFKPSHFTRGKDGAPSEVYPPLTAEADRGDQDPVVAFAQNQRDEVRTMEVAGALAAEPGMKQQTFLAERFKAGSQESGEQEPIVISQRGREGGPNIETRQDGTANAILTPNGGRAGMGVGAICTSHPAVRRLTPVECARLQGFPDEHTDITYRGKPAADGPQYKAYGNSMAVPVMAWILDRFGGCHATR